MTRRSVTSQRRSGVCALDSLGALGALGAVGASDQDEVEEIPEIPAVNCPSVLPSVPVSSVPYLRQRRRGLSGARSSLGCLAQRWSSLQAASTGRRQTAFPRLVEAGSKDGTCWNLGLSRFRKNTFTPKCTMLCAFAILVGAERGRALPKPCLPHPASVAWPGRDQERSFCWETFSFWCISSSDSSSQHESGELWVVC